MKRTILMCAFLLPWVLSAAVTGEWRGTATVTDPATNQQRVIGIYANLTQNGSQITGSASTSQTMLAIQNAVLSGTTLTFSIPEGGGPAKTSFALNDSGNTLVGTVTLNNGQTLPVTLTLVR